MAGEIEKALFAHLTAWPYLSAQTGDRVYPMSIPNDASLPAVAYQRISGRRLVTHGGPAGLAEARIQITIVGADYEEAKELAGLIRAYLEGYRGMMGGICDVYNCTTESEIDGYGEQTEAVTVRLDLFFLYRE